METIKIEILVVVMILLQLLDVISTKIALANPTVFELMPIGGYFISRGMYWEFFFIKLGVLSLALGLALLVNIAKESIIRMGWLLNIIMVIVIANNFYWGLG